MHRSLTLRVGCSSGDGPTYLQSRATVQTARLKESGYADAELEGANSRARTDLAQHLVTGVVARSTHVSRGSRGRLRATGARTEAGAAGTRRVGHGRGGSVWIAPLLCRNDAALVSGSSDGTIRRWRTSTGEVERAVQATQGEVRSVAGSSDGGSVVAGLRYGGIQCWDIDLQ